MGIGIGVGFRLEGGAYVVVVDVDIVVDPELEPVVEGDEDEAVPELEEVTLPTFEVAIEIAPFLIFAFALAAPFSTPTSTSLTMAATAVGRTWKPCSSYDFAAVSQAAGSVMVVGKPCWLYSSVVM